MKTYKITSNHNVYIDSYTEGEQEHANSYTISEEVKAVNPMRAIRKYFGNVLLLSFKPEYAHIEGDRMHYDNTVNADNIEPTKHELKQWKENKLTLYNNTTTITVQELTPINLQEPKPISRSF